MTNWPAFFPEGTTVVALPNWTAPRLLVSARTSLERWQRSAFYPAFRRSARLLRLALRAWSSIHPGPVWRVTSTGWALGDFLQDVLPDTHVIAVLIGTPGPAQKLTVECRDANQHVLGYVKYAQSSAARRRLQQERAVLDMLPEGVGPSVLKYACWQDGEALVLSPVPGHPLPAKLPPSQAVHGLVRRFMAGAPIVEGIDHPWLHVPRPASLTNDVAQLALRPWPIVLQHGDLAPWNVHQSADDALHAIDWEYGTGAGFPFIDLAQYTLQIAALIHRWRPARAARYATTYIAALTPESPPTRMCAAMIRLAAYDAFHANEEDGVPADAPLQRWRHAIWSAAT